MLDPAVMWIIGVILVLLPELVTFLPSTMIK